MSFIDEAVTHPVPLLSAIEPRTLSGKESIAAAGRENEKLAEQPLENVIEDSDPDFVIVDFEENDPQNPLNWSPMHKWLIVIVVSWMGFVSVFSTMTIVPTAPQVLQEFHSNNKIDQTLLVTIWELGEGIGPFFIAPLSERFGRLPVFHIGNLLALCCLIASALSVNIPMLIAFRFLTGCFLSILTLGPTIVGDLFRMEQTGRSMAVVMATQLMADFISPIAGAYIAQGLGWRWSIWLAAIVLGFFSLLLLAVLRETYAVVILRRKAERLQEERAADDNRTYRSKHQARVDASTMLENAIKPMHILAQSPILILTTSYMATTYALVSLIMATLTETMESTYPSVFSSGSIGLTFLSLAIGNAAALIFYTFTSDRYVTHQRETKGDAFKPESRLVHLLLAAIILPLGFLIYGWTLESHVHYIVPLVGTCAAGFSMTLSAIPAETYVVDVYEIHGASAIAAGVIFRAIAGAFLPLIGPPLYQSIGQGWGNTVLAFIAAVFIPPLGLMMRYGDWFHSKERFGKAER
ncbi:MFS general substrate transporter [Aspergillus homomorphus CBS 101889]|uniref:MFS general substrate transporter n=1 Tax=Aspergillus homomorphus (strain CBS 101889) TaxID=1450537 RepID=A0A395HJH9_ASPHC|nr:MFS general substrate transporter [Aspergillus homomorphus CBS 101889]RAL07669.1 MFS general substrate transporter [Aspergillus homomorphus CBS 101889]